MDDDDGCTNLLSLSGVETQESLGVFVRRKNRKVATLKYPNWPLELLLRLSDAPRHLLPGDRKLVRGWFTGN